MPGKKNAKKTVTATPATEGVAPAPDAVFRPLEAEDVTKLSDNERADRTQFRPLLSPSERKK